MWILRLNMSDLSYRLEDVPETYKHLGGRGLTSTLIHDEVPPLCHPLGPNNKLVFAPGFLTGTTAPSSSRISVGAKSPLTGGIKESNAGASWAPDVAKMRLKAIVVEGQPKEKDKYWVVVLTWEGDKPKVKFLPAAPYTGKDLYEVFPQVYARFGNKISIAGCGVSGEYRYANSGIVFNDMAKRPSRYSGRGGLGAVMASKGVKFIVVDSSGAPGVELADKTLFNQGRKKMIEGLQTHALTKPKGGLNTYGTAVLINIINEAGGLPTRSSRVRPTSAVRPSSRATRSAPGRKYTIMPAVRGASSSAPTPCTKRMDPSTSRVSNTNRTGRWVPTAGSTTWMTSPSWCGCATPTG